MRNLSTLEQARLALKSGKDIPAGTLAAPVAESWARCRRLGLDPETRPSEVVVSFAEVQRKREELRACRRLALAEMQVLHSQISGSGSVVAFADRDGLVIDTLSDPQFAATDAGKAIIPGSFWGEAAHGTNALGLLAISADTATVHGSEHYFTRDAYLSCVAAPIFNTRGEMIGAIDATCANSTRQQHTQVLVKMAATQVSNALFFQEQPGFYILAFHPRAEYLNTLSTGLVAVSGEGEIISMNRFGRAFLGEQQTPGELEFQDAFDSRFEATMKRLLGGETVHLCDSAGSALFMTCRQIARGVARMPAAHRPKAPPPASSPLPADFACEDPALLQMLKRLGRAAQHKLPIHIFGETGTGKEVVARHVHEISGRAGNFVAVNCGAIPETLFVSELFGYEKGAYTGASHQGATGLARQADRGTLFLDEVADIPMSAQAALLRFLDSFDVRPLGGGSESHRVDVQIVSATNQDLEAAVTAHRFRADLLFRLSAFTTRLPPLRERQDFSAIARHLAADLAEGTTLTDAAIERLRLHRWPGNIRELRSYLQRLLLDRDDASFLDETDIDAEAAEPETACPACRSNPLRARRCREINAVYEVNGHNVSEVARRLGLSRTTVYKHLCRSRTDS
jgi:transcriptional regulator of acetoin/glycerol metabolism